MSKKANPALVGSFVIGAVALVVIAVAVLGGADLFRPRDRAVVYFDSSVNGLGVGSPVTWLGVRVGSVTKIRMDFDADRRTIHIPVFIEFEPERFNIVGRRESISVRDLVQRGLKAQLQLQSMVTGQLYVDLEMRPDLPSHTQGPGQFLVPEIPTMKSELDTLKETLEKLPFKELGENAITTLVSINRLVNSPELKTLLTQLSASSAELQATLQEIHAQVKPLSSSLEGGADAFRGAFSGMTDVEKDMSATLGDFRSTAHSTDAQVVKMAGDLHNALAAADQSFREAQAALASVNSVVAINSPQRADLDQVLRNLAYATQALRAFSEELARNPNALITGNK